MAPLIYRQNFSMQHGEDCSELTELDHSEPIVIEAM
jgi:hypothetical protein